ncbi:MAG TPA: acyl-CoA dehydrogenase family protein [Ilumatobacteraceae bacterium]|nr:acyl-CoA dehydrogenase family protein [Ilumatobacteraceae bacterium]
MIAIEDFRSQAAAWIAEHAAAAPPDYGAICPHHLLDPGVDWQRAINDAGYAGIHWPAEYGGAALTPEHNGAWQYECALAGVPAAFNMVGLVLAGGALLRFGTEQQKQRHLKATLGAEHVWCQLFSEPGAGSDLAGLTTRARQDGEQFIIDGQKVWCSGGRYSNWGILMARTDPDAAKHKGISFFLLPMDLPGVDVRPLRQMTGDSEFDEVFFTDVRLPADHLLGPLHDGWNVGMTVLTNERGHIGTSIIGLERQLQAMASFADGRDVSASQRDALTRLLATGSAYKAMAQRQGPIASVAASLMKLGITEMMFESAVLRTTMTGAHAMVDGAETTRFLAAPGGRIAGGTSQVQRNIIGERLLGLPREPRPSDA